VSGAVERPGVYEVPRGEPLARLITGVGGSLEQARAVLLGGYFGSWIDATEASAIRLDEDELAMSGWKLGAGVVYVLAGDTCGVTETAAIMRFLAEESARQCGPCDLGLTALADLVHTIASGRGRRVSPGWLERWIAQLREGRGACHHPDGAVGLLASAHRCFHDDFELHFERGACGRAFNPYPLPVGRPDPDAWR
jgi:NADH:ubiquinone oxidoreductase subunit F (NADH-binding)